MTNENIIAQMREICRLPRPEGKTVFFSRLKSQGRLEGRPMAMNHVEFLAVQLRYINKWIWMLSGILLLFIVWVCRRSPGNYPFALTPLLAAGILLETGRSRRWQMSELEYAARFSLRSVVLARMFLVGFVDTAGLLVVVAVVRSWLAYSIFRVFLYMAVPYLMASFLGSLYERKMKTDSVLGSLAICLLSSTLFAAAPYFMSWLYESSLTMVWAAAFLLLAGCLGVNMREYMHEMEDAAWN